jgi:lipopolysaccharide heptosyltransferase II
MAKKILIFNPFGIGDVLFSTPLVRNLKNNIPGVSISYMCNRRVEPILKTSPLFDSVFVFEKDEWRALARHSKMLFWKNLFAFFNAIRREKFDVVFDFSLNAQYGLFLKMAGIKKRIGFNFKNRGKFLTDKIDLPRGYEGKHVARWYLDTARFLKLDCTDHPFELNLSPDVLKQARGILGQYNLLCGKPLIVVCPGSGDSWGGSADFKRWPAENFSRLCEKVSKELECSILLLGSKNEEPVCLHVAEDVPSAVNLCGKLPLELSCALIGLSDLIVTNDGGPLHIAQAMNKKSVAFFGPVDENVYGAYPDGRNAVIFSSSADCRPCYGAFKFRGCVHDKRCLREIDVDRVFLKVKELIGEVKL